MAAATKVSNLILVAMAVMIMAKVGQALRILPGGQTQNPNIKQKCYDDCFIPCMEAAAGFKFFCDPKCKQQCARKRDGGPIRTLPIEIDDVKTQVEGVYGHGKTNPAEVAGHRN